MRLAEQHAPQPAAGAYLQWSLTAAGWVMPDVIQSKCEIMKATLSLVIISASVAILAIRDVASSADRKAAVTAVSVRDIGTKVELVGRLGHPLGTFLTVDGTWGFPDQTKRPTKDYSLRFTIHRVNDKALLTPIQIDVGSVKVTDQRGWSLIPQQKTTYNSTVSPGSCGPMKRGGLRGFRRNTGRFVGPRRCVLSRRLHLSWLDSKSRADRISSPWTESRGPGG